MTGAHKLTIEELKRMNVMAELGISYRQIAKKLEVTVRTVTKIMKKVCEIGTVKDKVRSGRP